jgi:hypothetical protein
VQCSARLFPTINRHCANLCSTEFHVLHRSFILQLEGMGSPTPPSWLMDCMIDVTMLGKFKYAETVVWYHDEFDATDGAGGGRSTTGILGV